MRTLLVFLLGVLVGANALYFAMTRWHVLSSAAPAPRPAPPAAAQPATPGAPVDARPAAPPATPSIASSPATAAGVAPGTTPAPAAPARAAAIAAVGPALAMPLATVQPAQLVDTFDELRGTDRRHEALDIPAPAGTPVLAVADGRIEKLFTSVPGGLTIYQFEPSGRYAYYYAHLQGYADGLAEGRAVRRGEVIGYVGSTGNARPDAPHLHFAVFELGPEKRWWQGTAINPYPLLGGRAPGATVR